VREIHTCVAIGECAVAIGTAVRKCRVHPIDDAFVDWVSRDDAADAAHVCVNLAGNAVLLSGVNSVGAMPVLSVVFVTAEGDATTLEAMLAALSRQTIAADLEVIVVAQERAPIPFDPRAWPALFHVRVVRCADRALFGEALALGVRSSTAPIVAIVEDHCTPHYGWAAALLRRHADGYAVVGSEISNANAGSSLSWVNFVLTHSRWAAPAIAGEVATVAGDNCSYSRRALDTVDGELDALLASGTVLHQRLRQAGHRIFLEPEAKLEHITPSTFSAYVGSFFHSGRLFAALVSRPWPWWRRAWLAAVSPLIASRWVLRLLPGVTRAVVGPRVWAVRGLMLIAIPVSAAGYAAGFLFGGGGSPRYTSDVYFHRYDHLNASDQPLVEALRKQSS
jgi:hypothetical protein